MINAQFIFTATQKTDQPKSYAFSLWAFVIVYEHLQAGTAVLMICRPYTRELEATDAGEKVDM